MGNKLFIIFTFVLAQISIGQINSRAKEIDSLNQLSGKYAYTQKDSAYFYFELAKNLAIEEESPKKLMATYLGVNWIASYHYDLGSLFSNLKALDSIILARNTDIDKIDPDAYMESATDFQWGTYYYLINDYNNSRKFFLKMARTVKNLSDSLVSQGHMSLTTIGDSYLAKMYTDEGKYDLAKAIYEKNLRVIEKSGLGHEQSLSDNYSLLASLYSKEGDIAKSNHYFLKSLNYFLKTDGNLNSIISTAENLAYNHIALGQLDSVRYYLNIIEKNMPKGHKFEYRFYGSKAEFLKKSKKYSEASKAYEKALVSVKNKWKNKRHSDVAMVYNDFGLMKLDEQLPKKALELFQLGLAQLNMGLGNGLQVVSLLRNKSLANLEMGTPQYYQNALEDVDRAVVLLDSLKPSFKSQSDKLALIEDAFPLFEVGMEASYKLGSDDKNARIDKAFYFAEKSKAVILLDALLGAKATKFSNIPQVMLEREKQLKSQIAHIEKTVDSSPKKSDAKADELFSLHQEYLSLINSFEQEYPTYYDLRYNNEVLNIDMVQSNLTQDELFISYFYGNEAIYTIAVSQDSKHFYRIPNDSALEDQIRRVHKMLGDPRSARAILAKESFSLYQRLLQPIIKTGQKTKLIIVPDGLLNYIPFGSLNTSATDCSYLMETMSIAYAQSATLWSKLHSRKNKGNSILAFAPTFENTGYSLGKRSEKLLPLPHNKREVSQIMTSFGGDSFFDAEASLTNFNNRLADYGILHLATHAKFDDTAPEYSYLAFTPKNNEEYLLYVRDLYNLNLDAALVTLSACETGIGELKRGEGFIGLARGFFYSGASSIASTLWKVNDGSSTNLMGLFYENLAKGNTKDVALQNAKMAFLKVNSQNALAHPYYWAGFVVSGNTSPLTETDNWIWIVLGSVSVILGGIFYFKKKRSA